MAIRDDTDEELAIRARDGSRDAFRELHRRHSRVVFRRVVRLMGDGPDVDDVVQDVFVELHRSLRRFDPERPFRNWMFRIVRNVTVDHLRRRPTPLDPTGLDAFSLPDRQWRKLAARQKVRILDAALTQVGTENREAFVLHTLEGMTLREIAEQTGASINTIAARVRRTREKLAAILDRKDRGRSAGSGEPS